MATKSTPDVSSDPAPHLVSQATPPPPKGTREKVSRQERRRKERFKRNRKAPPLSVDNVMAVLGGVAHNWRSVGQKLYIPDYILTYINGECKDDFERLRRIVRYWLLKDPLASWRRLICGLYNSNVDDLVNLTDTIKEYAERLTDPSLTSSAVLSCLETVCEDMRKYIFELLGAFKPGNQTKETSVQLYLQISPYASWEHLAGQLFRFDRTTELEKSNRKIKPIRDSTLTLSRLTSLLDSVHNWDRFYVWLDTPVSKYNDIIKQHSNVTKRNKALCEFYLTNHPAPSWRHIAQGLYGAREHEVLEVLRDQGHYLKAPPLSVDSVMAVLGGVAHKWRNVGEELYIPDATLSYIGGECKDDLERLRRVVRYWILKDPSASWRRLIHLLYGLHYMVNLADTIKEYAEKLADPSLTSSAVLSCLETVQHMKTLWGILELPYVMRRDNQTMETSVQLYLQLSPYASWEHLAVRLFKCGQTDLAKNILKRIKLVRDSTLTLSRLTSLLGSVGNWNRLHYWLNIPIDTYERIKCLHSNWTERNKALFEWYLTNHPAPSWRHIAEGLYGAGEHEVLEVLRDQVHYLKGSKESRRLFSESMKQGHVESQVNKVLLYGAAGVGKSSFLDVILGNPPAQIRRSTPLAARPVTVFQVDMSNKKWEKLSPKQRKNVLVKAAMSNWSRRDEEEDLSSDDDSISDEEETEENTVPVNSEAKHNSSSQDPHHTPHLAGDLFPSSPVDTSQPDKTAILKSISKCDDLVQLMEECSKTGDSITIYCKVILIDSGGQPQFHEILPVFLRRMGLYMFVFKLSEELATKPIVEYYGESGKALGTPFKSAHTNEQLLQHCLRTLHTHRSISEEKSHVMIIGTHRDKEEECTTETRKEKNQKLAGILLPSFKEEVTCSNQAESEFIFAVNAKNPQAQDRDLVEDIRHLILTKCCPKPVKVPLRYYCLEIILEEVTEDLSRGVFSIDECLEAAAELHFDRHTLDAALQFLDQISVVLYFPEVLEGVLFTNPQVLLDKATELVEEMYVLRCSDCVRIVPVDFIDHALFTLEFLQQESFQNHYLPGVFTPVELVKLFKKLLIFAEMRDGKLFMPALLRVLEDDKVCECRVAGDSPAAALALDFPLGGPRHGTYCTLTCFLVSHNNQFPCAWEVVLQPHSNVPVCLYRNCIRFSIPGFPGSVTLIDTFTHFEVHVTTASKVCSELCHLVRQAILTGVKTATHTLGYQDCTPSLAVVCPCEVGTAHVATVGRGLWTCKQDKEKYGDLPTNCLVWEESASRKKGQPTSSASSVSAAVDADSITLSEEYSLLKRHRRATELAVMSDMKWLAEELNDDSVAILNDQQYTDVTEVKTLLNEEERAGIVVKALLNRVEQDAEELKTFVDILKKKSRKFKALIAKLDIL